MHFLRALLFGAILAASHCQAAQNPSTPAAPVFDSPPCVRAGDAGASPFLQVLGVCREGECCAYPLTGPAAFRVVNDHLGGPPILVAYDPETAIGQAYDPVVDGRTLSFQPAGRRGGLPALRDRETGTYWSQVSGSALEGPLAGKSLMRIPVYAITWARWREFHPDTWMIRPSAAAEPVASNLPPPAAASSRSRRADRRLPADALVLGVAGVRDAYALPLNSLARSPGVINDHLDGRMTVILYDAGGRAAAAYRPSARGKALVLRSEDRPGGRVFVDDLTGSTWTLEGAAVAGPLMGAQLPPESYTVSRWRAWSAAHPGSRIYDPRRWR